jgi:ATP-binding protein involved in chromosome partitioning
MAVHICSECGHAEHIFGAEGGQRIASDYGVSLLASLPLAMSIREQTDSGNPTVVAEPDSPVAVLYRQAAEQVQATLGEAAQGGVQPFPEITISDD